MSLNLRHLSTVGSEKMNAGCKSTCVFFFIWFHCGFQVEGKRINALVSGSIHSEQFPYGLFSGQLLIEDIFLCLCPFADCIHILKSQKVLCELQRTLYTKSQFPKAIILFVLHSMSIFLYVTVAQKYSHCSKLPFL